MESEKFLLTGDAGLLALNAAADYAESYIHDLKAVKILPNSPSWWTT